MKLRSTLLFAAASLSASALAPVIATTATFFAASAVPALATDGETKEINGNETFTESETFAAILVKSASNININDGIVITTDRYVGGNNSGANTVLNINSGGTLTYKGTEQSNGGNGGGDGKNVFMLAEYPVAGTVNVEGTFNLSAGLSNRDGTGTLNVKNGGVANFTKILSAVNNGGSTTVNLENGGRINIGSEGIAANNFTLNLNGGTIGILGSDATASWSSSRNLTLPTTGTPLTIDTTVYKMAEDGNSSSATEFGGTITLSGTVSGLNAVGTNFIVAGSGKLAVTGTLNVVDGGNLTICGTHKLFSLDGDATVEVSKYTWNGRAIIFERAATTYTKVARADGSAKYTFVTFANAADLVWTGTGDDATASNNASGNWDKSSNNWKNGDTADKFYSGDNVTFSLTESGKDSATVTITEALNAGKVSFTAGTVTLANSNSGYVYAADGIVVSGAGNNSSSDSSTATTVLKLGGGGSTSILRGSLAIEKGGKVELTSEDATGYSTNSSDTISSIYISEGGELSIQTDVKTEGEKTKDNQTFYMSGGITLKGGKITGKSNKSKFDLFNSSTGITTLSSDTTAEISASIGLRNNGTFTVAKGTTADGVDLLISGMLTNKAKVDADGDYTLNASLTKNGAGTMKLTGDNSNWTTGGTVNAGTLIIASTGAGTGAITVNSGALLVLASNKSVSSGNLVVNANGTLEVNLKKSTETTGTPTGDTGTASVNETSDTGTATTEEDATVLSYSGNLTGSGTVNITAGTLKLTSAENNFSGIINIYDGGVLDITTENAKLMTTYNNTSVVSVKAGGEVKVAKFAWDGSFGKQPDWAQHRVLDGGKITVIEATDETGCGQGFTVTKNGGTFEVSTSGKTLTLCGNGNTNKSSSAVRSKIVLGGALKIGGAGNITITKNAAKVAIEGAGSLEKIGAGTLTINAEGNTYSGGTKVSEGKLIVGSATALGTGNVTVVGGATLEVFAGTTTDGATTGAVTLTFDNNKKLIFEKAATTSSETSTTTTASTQATLKGNITLNGGALVFADADTSVKLEEGTTLTLTSGTLDLSEVIFTAATSNSENSSGTTTTTAKAITLFEGSCANDTLKTKLEALTIEDGVGDTKGTFTCSDSKITYTAKEASLVWKNPTTEGETTPEQKWTSSSFSGTAYSNGDKRTFFFTDASGKTQTVTIEGTGTTTEGSTTTTPSVTAKKIIVDAGENGGYEFKSSENLKATTVKVKSGTLTVNDLGADDSLGSVIVESGANFVLASDNTGFDSITLNNSTLTLKSDSGFRDAGNKTTDGAILGTGTIVIALSDTSKTLSVDKLANALSNKDGSKFSGTISVQAGTFQVSTNYPGKFPYISYSVTSGGRITISGNAEDTSQNTIQNTIQIAGTGLLTTSATGEASGATTTTYTAGSEQAAALAFTGNATIKAVANIELTDNATIFAKENVTGTVQGVISGDHVLTKSGAGTLVLSNSTDVKSILVSAGTLQILNESATAGSSKLIGPVTLASGTTLELSSKNATPTAATELGSLTLQGDATLGIGTGSEFGGHWKIGTLSLATSDAEGTTNPSSATLTLKENHGAQDFAIFELGAGIINFLGTNNFSGKIVLEQSSASAGRHSALVISSEDIAQNAEISIGESKSSSAALVIGINASSVKIAGLSSQSSAADRTFLFSGTIATGKTGQNMPGSSFNTSWATGTTTRRTLEINVANTTGEGTTETTTVEKTFYGEILNNLNLVKTGAGTQTLAGTSTDFDGVVEIREGTLKLTAANALGTVGSAVTISANANLELAATSDIEFSNSIFGGGNLKKTGAGTVTLTGVGNNYSGGTTVSEGKLVATENESLGTGKATVSSGATLELSSDYALSFSNEFDGEGTLVKSGAGTATLKKLNQTSTTTISAGTLSYTLSENASEGFKDNAKVTIESGATLELTGKNITVTKGDITFADKTSTLLLGTETTATFTNVSLNGDYVVLSSKDLNSKLTLGSGTKLGENSSLLLKSDTAKVNVVVDSGVTITAANVEFVGTSGSEISGSGTLVVGANGKISSDDAGNTISTSKLQFSGDGTFETTRNLTISSEEVTATGTNSKLTKTGTGTLTFSKENALNKFSGSFSLEEGEIKIGDNGNGTLTIGSGKTYSSAIGTTLSGALTVDNSGTAALAGEIDGNLTLQDGSNLEFVGEVEGVKTFSWNTGTDGATVKLSGAFATLAGTTTLISFKSGLFNNQTITEDTDFSSVKFTGETADRLIGREVSLGYTETTTGGQLDLAITGALRWDNANFTTVEWVEDDPTSTKWLLVTASGLVSNENTYFQNGNFIEFYSDADSTFAGRLEIKRGSTVHTTGLQFSGERTDGAIVIAATGNENDGNATIASSNDGKGDAGIVIDSGNITITKGVTNNLTGGLYIYGGTLTVYETAALGTSKEGIDGDVFLGKVDTGSETKATLIFNEDMSVAQKIVLGNAEATIGVESGKTVTLSTALTQSAEAKAAKTTFALRKTGAGTLKIDRGSGLASLIVEAGKLAYTGTAEISGQYVSVFTDATLDFSESLLAGQDQGNTTGEKTSFSTLRVSGTVNLKNGTTYGAFRTNKIDGLSGTIYGDLYVGDSTEFTDTNDAKHKGTSITAGQGSSLKIVGSVGEYDNSATEEKGKLYKYGAGSLTLTGKTADGVAQKFSLAADFAHDAGTVTFSQGADVSGNYSVISGTDTTAIIRISGTSNRDDEANKSTFSGGFSASKSVAFLLGNKEQSLAFTSTDENVATFSATGANVSFLAKELSSTPNEFTITETGDYTVSFGNLQVGGDASVASAGDYGRVNLTIDAAKFSAGIISLGDGSKLTFTKTSMTEATATGIYVDEKSNLNRVVSELDLNGNTLKLTGTDDSAVIGGTGTLQISNGTLDVKGKNWVLDDDGEEVGNNSPKIILSGSATLNFEVAADGKATEGTVYTNLGGISTANTSDEAKGTVSKTGAGTLVIFDSSEEGELTFDGNVTLSAGTTELYARLSNATLKVEDDATLRFYGIETETEKIAGTLEGTGTLEVAGVMVIDENSSIDGFTGTFSAGTEKADDADRGEIIYGEKLATWQKAKIDGEKRKIVVQNGGWLIGTTTEALANVEVIGNGTFSSVVASNVSASDNSSIVLLGENNISNVQFSAVSGEDSDNELRIYGNDAKTTLGGLSKNLEKITVGSDATLSILAPSAVGNSSEGTTETPAEITSAGRLTFAAGEGTAGETSVTGTYANNITLNGELSVVAVLGSTELDQTVELTGTITNSSSAVFVAYTDDEDYSAKKATLILPESILDSNCTLLANGEKATVALNIKGDSGEKTLGENVTLYGDGTFEKKGTGTLKFEKTTTATRSISVAEGKLIIGENVSLTGGLTRGEISVASGATLEVKQVASLASHILTGEGTATFADKTVLAGMKDAKDVTLSGTLYVLGNISGSKITFSGTASQLEFAGDDTEQTVSGTTFTGETVTLVNNGAGTKTVDASNTFDSSTKKLVLSAQTDIEGGSVDATFTGSIEKIGGGTWTVSNYTFGKNASDTLTVSAGTLIWEKANVGDQAGTLTIASGATLSIDEVASGGELSATVGGAGTLEISGGTLSLETKKADGASWDLVVSNGSQVSVGSTTELPGGIEVRNKDSLLTITGQTTLDGDSLIVGEGATLKLSKSEGSETSPSFTQKESGTYPAQISGTVQIDQGTFNQEGEMAWGSSATLNVASDANFVVNVESAMLQRTNSATITGAGTLDFKKTGLDIVGSPGYVLSGDLSGFTGTATIEENAVVKITDSRAMFTSNATVNIENGGQLIIEHSDGGVLTNVKSVANSETSTTGTVLIDQTASNPTAISYGSGNTANVNVKSGILSVTFKDGPLLSGGRINIGTEDSKTALYKERYSQSGSVVSGASEGAFLEVKASKDWGNEWFRLQNRKLSFGDREFRLNVNDGSGLIFSGGNFSTSEDISLPGGSLVVADGASVDFSATTIDSNVYLSCGTKLEISPAGTSVQSSEDSTGTRAVVRDNTSTGTTSSPATEITGTLTLHGELKIHVNDKNVNNSALLATGKTLIGEQVVDSSGKVSADNSTGKITLVLDDTNIDVSNENLVLVTNVNLPDGKTVDDVLTIENASGTEIYEASRDAEGNLVLVSQKNKDQIANALGNLTGLYNAIRTNESSKLYSMIQTDLLNSEKLVNELVALSPVSFGSLIEMQSGFAAIENDLLRERLEQRRYERAFASDRTVEFKPFINIVGQSREGDGNGTESANYDVSHVGAIAGFDVPVSKNTIVGVSVGADWTEADLAENNGEHKGDGVRLGVYGMSVFENAYVGVGLSAGGMSFDTKRKSSYNGEVLEGETDGNDVNASIIAGLGYSIDPQLGLDVSPYVGVDIGYAHTKSFQEKGGKESALEMDSIDRVSVRGKIGATLNWRATENVRLGIDLALAHEFGDTDTDIDAKFASGDLAGTAFSTTAYLMDENTFSIGPRADIRIDDTWSVSGAFTYEMDFEDTTVVGGNVGVRARF